MSGDERSPAWRSPATHQVRIRPRLVDVVGCCIVCLLDLADEIVLLCLGGRLDDALGLEVGSELILIPGRIDVVLGLC